MDLLTFSAPLSRPLILPLCSPIPCRLIKAFSIKAAFSFCLGPARSTPSGSVNGFQTSFC